MSPPDQHQKRQPPNTPSTISKRHPGKSTPASSTFIYISSSTTLYPVLKKVRRALIREGKGRVTLCGMGKAVSRVGLLALQIQDMICPVPSSSSLSTSLSNPPPPTTSATDAMGAVSGSKGEEAREGERKIRLVIRTGTVELVDEVVPDDADLDVTTQVRRTSKMEVDLVVR